MPRMVRLISCLLALALAAPAAPTAQAGRAPHIESITADQLRADLFFLASDGMQGRLTATPANDLAADWVLARFQRLGLEPAGHAGTFDHRYELMTATLGEGNAMAVATGPVRLQLRALEDFYPHRFSANASVEAPLAFAGFGIVSPERGHDDYRGGVRGRIAVILEREPGVDDPTSIFDGVVTAEPAVPIKKVLAAQEKGAVGVIFVADVHNRPARAEGFEAEARGYWPDTPPRIERYTLKFWSDRVRIPVVQVSRPVAEQLVAPSGRTLLDLARSAETPGGVTPVPIETTVSMTTRVEQHTVRDRSIVAMLRGADPKLREEYVVVSAHFDHNGADASGVYAGADDNGSGTVALLEIAEAYALAAASGQRPRRSIIFAAWNSEERGLLGAWAYTEDPVVPLERIVAVLNMDMIGRNEEVPVGGGARFRGLELQTAESNANAVNVLGTVRSPDLRAIVERANGAIALDLRFRYDNNASNLMRRSDQWPFIQRGVPAVWMHTGLHPDYHTIYDRPEKINYPKMEKIARLVYQASWDLATSPSRPSLRPIAPATTAQR